MSHCPIWLCPWRWVRVKEEPYHVYWFPRDLTNTLQPKANVFPRAYLASEARTIRELLENLHCQPSLHKGLPNEYDIEEYQKSLTEVLLSGPFKSHFDAFICCSPFATHTCPCSSSRAPGQSIRCPGERDTQGGTRGRPRAGGPAVTALFLEKMPSVWLGILIGLQRNFCNYYM